MIKEFWALERENQCLNDEIFLNKLFKCPILDNKITLIINDEKETAKVPISYHCPFCYNIASIYPLSCHFSALIANIELPKKTSNNQYYSASNGEHILQVIS